MPTPMSEPIIPLELEIVDDDQVGTDVTESKKCGQYFPREETDHSSEMYEYYESLGRWRTLHKVAKHFNTSYSTVSLLSSRYGWKDRALSTERLRDVVVDESREPIDDARRKLVRVVNEVSDTLYEIMFIAKACKEGKMTLELEEKLERLRRSLSLWGFDWKSPTSFKALIETLKQVVDFNAEVRSKVQAKAATQIRAEKFELHIRD